MNVFANAIGLLADVVAAQSVGTQYNFGETLSWVPNSITNCNTDEEVIAVVNSARDAGNKVTVIGTGWSWNSAIAGDGHDYIKLDGDLANPMVSEVDFENQTAIIGGGVPVFDMYMILQGSGYDIQAKGGCLTAAESQTFGGMLATNVHHAGTKTFYDVVEWVEVVTSDGNLTRTTRDETLFKLTIGGKGRTGVIVRAKFYLSPEEIYESRRVSNQPSDYPNDIMALEALFLSYLDAMEGYGPNEAILVGSIVPLDRQIDYSYSSRGFASISGKYKISSDQDLPAAILPPNYGDMGSKQKKFDSIDNILDSRLDPVAYNFFYLPSLATVLQGEQPKKDRNTRGEVLSLAAAGSSTPHMKHQEIEFFVPVDILGPVGAWIDDQFKEEYYPFIQDNGLWTVRYVFGCESLTAANGVLPDGTSPDVVAVNLDCYQRSQWDLFNEEVDRLMIALSNEFPEQIRLHPGKYDAPLDRDTESNEVKELIEGFDPIGMFARETKLGIASKGKYYDDYYYDYGY